MLAAGLRTRSSILKKRLNHYPEGQYVLVFNNQVVGVIYSQRIAKIEDIRTNSILTVDTLHDPTGCIVQLLCLNILPKFQQRSLGDQLLEFMLQCCSLMKRVESVVGVTLCKGYYEQHGRLLEDYIRERNEHGRLVDPVLRFHELHGARIEGLIPGYRPNDKKNKGCGVLVYYGMNHRKRDDLKINRSGKMKTIANKNRPSPKAYIGKKSRNF